MVDDKETGFRWWLRYVIVPLIGSGGIIAIVVAVINRPAPMPREQVKERNSPTQNPAQTPSPQPTAIAAPAVVSGSPDNKQTDPRSEIGTQKLPDFYLKTRDGKVITNRGSVRDGSRATAYWDIKNPKGTLYYGCAATRYFVPRESDAVEAKSWARSAMDCYSVHCTLYCSLLDVKNNEIVNYRSIEVDIKP